MKVGAKVDVSVGEKVEDTVGAGVGDDVGESVGAVGLYGSVGLFVIGE